MYVCLALTFPILGLLDTGARYARNYLTTSTCNRFSKMAMFKGANGCIGLSSLSK